jgi:hypothetical protein
MTATMRPEVIPAWSSERGAHWTVLFNTRDNPAIRMRHKATKDGAERWARWLERRQGRASA